MLNRRKVLYASVFLALSLLFPFTMSAEEEMLKYGDFNSWITRTIKESIFVGGKTQTLYEVGPTGTFDGARAYTNQGGSPWACSNVYAKVAGVVKTNVSVFPDKHGNGQCAKLYTHIVSCKAIGIVNISVLATGSLFLGTLLEPITSSNDPMSKMSIGVPFNKRPKAVKFDYKYYTPDTKRIRETGFSRRQTIPGKDMGQVTCLLQKRWEDADGNVHALRVGTGIERITRDVPEWVNGHKVIVHYGDITAEPYFKEYMGLNNDPETAFHALNSKGENVVVSEDGWADADAEPNHMIIHFISSCGKAFYGGVGNTLWVDNVSVLM